MSIYLGTLGRMIELKCPSSQRVSVSAQPVFKATLGGRVVAEMPPRADRRAWDLQTSDATTPDQIAQLLAFAGGAWGLGPFWFVSADAPFTNLLTPAAASCDPTVMTMSSGATLLGSPPLLTPDGWAARSVWKTTTNGALLGAPVPVIPGQKVTASAYAAGAAGYVSLVFLNAAGSVVSQHNSAVVSTVSSRRSVTVSAPALAISARVSISASVTQAAMPAITWTDTVQPFSDGQGCPKAVLHGASRDLVLAGAGRTYSSLSFMVTEVG